MSVMSVFYKMFVSSLKRYETYIKIKLGDLTRIDFIPTYFHQSWKIRAYVVVREIVCLRV